MPLNPTKNKMNNQQEKNHCGCRELLIEDHKGKKHELSSPNYPEGRHDCAEVRRRNTFIPLAESNALLMSGDAEDAGFGNRFTANFSREMERLCKQ